MIYTCTLNPSLDYYMEFDKPLKVGENNRSQLEFFEAGGKGINVSIVLNNLMIPTRAFGFIGGFTRHFYIDLLQKYEYIQPSFTYIEGHTRINVKINAEDETDLNAAGPYITSRDMELLRRKVEKLDEMDIFIFSGNCPEYILDDVVDMINELLENDVRVILDTNAQIIRKCINNKPFLIKPTLADLEALFDTTLSNQAQIVERMEECVKMGAENVLIQLPNEEGSLYACKDGVYKSDAAQKDKIVNTVGSADSMVAGFVMNYIRSSDGADSFKFATCCMAATSFSKGLGTREKINALYESAHIDKIK